MSPTARTAPPRNSASPATAPRRVVRLEPAPPRPVPPARPLWLPREASLGPSLAAMGALAGLAIAYAAAHATPTGAAYELRALNRRIAEEQKRAEELRAAKTLLVAQPRVVAEAKKLGIDVFVTYDHVLEPRP